MCSNKEAHRPPVTLTHICPRCHGPLYRVANGLCVACLNYQLTTKE